MASELYNTMLNAGVGMVNETIVLLGMWKPEMSLSELNSLALQSGQFPNITARRLRNLLAECFSPRYLTQNGAPAKLLKSVQDKFSSKEFKQLLFVFTCRENRIFRDFVQEVYWTTYVSGKEKLGNEEALAFVVRANQDGKTTKPWSENTIKRVARYLTGSCADFDLLESGSKSSRKILPFQIEPRVLALLAYELHFEGLGDNGVLNHADWKLFGMEREDVLNEFKRHARKSWFIVQSAGDVVRIGWQAKNKEELLNVIVDG
ncbi:DUF1819 family protein [Chloroflexota bacterium]